MKPTLRATIIPALLLLLAVESAGAADRQPVAARKPKPWTPLFDGKSLKGWKLTKFAAPGEVVVKNGRILLHFGDALTGIHTTRKLPKTNYEVRLQAMRVKGGDFFCGFTFPVGKSYCSLILGGWGGGVCGLSSIDKLDASENETTFYRGFQNGEWFNVRVRVTDKKIDAWLDGKHIVDQDLKGHKISVRAEVLPSRPFGFASFQTTAALRNIRLRRVPGK